METECEIPSLLTVMTLPETVFFPRAILPLHIFEERYRTMLRDVLQQGRLFAVACQAAPGRNYGAQPVEELPARMATVGMIRAAHENADGTSNLVLQGLCRVEVIKFSNQPPYPVIEVRPLVPEVVPDEIPTISAERREILGHLREEQTFVEDLPGEFLDFLDGLEDPEAFIDLTAFATCQCARTKQRLLETLDLAKRYQLLREHLEGLHRQRLLHRRLQGAVADDEITLN